MNIDELKQKLANDPALRLKFISDIAEILEKNGVDLNAEDVRKALGIEFDPNTKTIKFPLPLAASTGIVTVVM